MNILLINPPRSEHNGILRYAPEGAKGFIHKKLIGPPLGLLSVAAAVKDFNVTLVDLKGEYDLPENAGKPLEELVVKWLGIAEPDIAGVTFIASEFPAGMEIFRIIKRERPGTLCVAGGLHTILCEQDFLHKDCVDLIVSGNSPYTFRDVVESLASKKDITDVKGIVINREGGVIRTGRPRRYNVCGSQYIAPDREMIKPWISTYRVGGNTDPVTYMYTSLGCPYRCTFCSIWPQFNGDFLQRDVESIVNELKSIPEYRIVRFADANTVVNSGFMHKLFDRILRENIRKEFIMDIRFDTAVSNPGLISKMADAGLKVVICGFESYRREELEEYNKGADPALIEKAIWIFESNGIMIRGNYVVPPDYTEEDFFALSEYASSHKVVYAGYTILTPMPGTPLYREWYHRIIDHDRAKYNFFNSVTETTLPYEEFHRNVGALWLIKKGSDVI